MARVGRHFGQHRRFELSHFTLSVRLSKGEFVPRRVVAFVAPNLAVVAPSCVMPAFGLTLWGKKRSGRGFAGASRGVDPGGSTTEAVNSTLYPPWLQEVAVTHGSSSSAEAFFPGALSAEVLF